MDIIDIGSEGYESLSNFHKYKFKFRGFECESMEGLLQSFKFPIFEKQLKLIKLSGIKAKRKGQKKKWYLDYKLYWNGEVFCRFSENYQNLILEAFQSLYDQNEDFRLALDKTKDKTLVHSVGKKSEKYTILTEYEFTSTLTKIRDRG